MIAFFFLFFFLKRHNMFLPTAEHCHQRYLFIFRYGLIYICCSSEHDLLRIKCSQQRKITSEPLPALWLNNVFDVFLLLHRGAGVTPQHHFQFSSLSLPLICLSFEGFFFQVCSTSAVQMATTQLDMGQRTGLRPVLQCVTASLSAERLPVLPPASFSTPLATSGIEASLGLIVHFIHLF